MDASRAIRGSLPYATLASLLVVLHADTSHAQWVQTNGPRGGTSGALVAVSNGAGAMSVFAGPPYVWRTDDNGTTWSRSSTGLTDPNASDLIAVPGGSGGSDLFVGTNGGVFRSSDQGVSWTPVNAGITNLSIYALASGSNGAGGTNLYAGAFLGNAYRSTDHGASWTAIQSGLPLGYSIGALSTTASGTLLAGTMNGIYRSTNFGASWTQVLNNRYGFSFARNGPVLYAGTSGGVYRSANDGASWTPINAGIESMWTYSLAAIPNGTGGATLFAGGGYVLRSTDNGATWTVVNNGMSGIGVYALTTAPGAGGGTDLYAGTSEGVFRSTNHGDSWTNVGLINSRIAAVQATPSGAILAGTDMEVFRSTDVGATWIDTNSQARVFDFAINPNGTHGVSLFVAGLYTGVRKSIDDGVTWTDANYGIDVDDLEVNSVGVVPNGSGGSNILAGTYNGIFLSTNDGDSWQQANPDAIPLDYVAIPNGSGGHDVFAGGFNGVWLSRNYGQTWAWTGLPGTIHGMVATANGATLFAGGDPFGVYRSIDHGTTWTLVNEGLGDLRIHALRSPDGTNLFAAGSGGVFLSTDQGESWSSVGEGLTTGVTSLAVSPDGSSLIAGTEEFGVWKRPLAEMLDPVVAVPNPTTSAVLALHTSRPNPFALQTTISFTLPQAMPVRLVVYDVTGRAVRTLLDGLQNAGEGRATWDGRDDGGMLVAAGMYVCRLDAGGVHRTRKLALLR